ncbi:MAG TPA: MFS transporter, partial [Janthinobacterium sp.]|nr:MFS transporter [Janthinobacterium sp.]
AFLLSGLTMVASMLVIPFISPVLVSNLGVEPGDITWIYLAGGCATLFSARLIGIWSDRHGKHRVYRWVTLAALPAILFMTHLPLLSLAALILFFPFFMTSVSGRNIPMQALLTTIPEPAKRGAFLSANSAIQQLGSGLGAWLGGLSLHTDAAGHISGYGINGWLSVGLSLLAVAWVGRVHGAAQPPRMANGAEAV